MSSPDQSYQKNREDVDLGLLLHKSGTMLKQVFVSIGNSLTIFFKALTTIMLFFMKNIIWLIAGTALGLGYGIYTLNTRGSTYYAEMTVKANFNSTRSLYNAADYFNALINKNRVESLSSIFQITPQEAGQLTSFSVQPIKSELVSADLYKRMFLEEFRSEKVRQDTFWTRTIKYEDFKKSLSNFDYPYQKVMVTSTNPLIFSKLENGLISQVSENTLLKQTRDRQVTSNKTEERTILAALESLDTLRQTYNQRLLKAADIKSPGNNITMLENSSEFTAPELDLYDKMLELLDELKTSRQKSVTENDILEVYSKFNPVGQEISIFRQSIARYTLLSFITTLLILSIIQIFKFLKKVEKKRLADNMLTS